MPNIPKIAPSFPPFSFRCINQRKVLVDKGFGPIQTRNTSMTSGFRPLFLYRRRQCHALENRRRCRCLLMRQHPHHHKRPRPLPQGHQPPCRTLVWPANNAKSNAVVSFPAQNVCAWTSSACHPRGSRTRRGSEEEARMMTLPMTMTTTPKAPSALPSCSLLGHPLP